MLTCNIYALSDPNTGEIRYIGKTIRTLARRLRGHLKDGCKCHRTNWIKSLSSPPKIFLIECCNQSAWEERERYWISHFTKLGCRLTNQTFGGDGPGKFHKEVREKISIALKGRRLPCTAKRAAAISAAKRGKSNGLSGIPKNQITKDKISAALRGRPSPLAGKRQPAWLIEKRIKSRRSGAGFKHSDHVKKMLSQNHPMSRKIKNPITGIVYASIADASRKTLIPESTIRLGVKSGKWIIPTDTIQI